MSLSTKVFGLKVHLSIQAENGHPEEGFTYTSYVYWSKEDCDALEDPIEALIEVYFSPTDLVLEVPHAIDKFMRKNKIKR